MICAEAYLKFVMGYILEHCAEDVEFFDTFIEKGLIQRLKNVLELSLRSPDIYQRY